MKRILCLILCLVMACTMLVACDKAKIGDYIVNYPESGDVVEKLTLNLYIIVGEGTDENAKISVEREISSYTQTHFKTVLNVFYVEEANYEKTVTDAIKAGGENVPHIILVKGETMFDSLVNASKGESKLLDLTAYLNSKTYGSLNTQISPALLQGSRVAFTSNGVTSTKLFTIPNNHVIDSYDYLMVDEETARYYQFSDTKIAGMTTDEFAAAVTEKLKADGKSDTEIAELVFKKQGDYAMKGQYEKNGYLCLIEKYPTVDRSEAFSSAFAIVENPYVKYNDRAMQILYKMNSDSELRNLIQYGVKNSNYTLDNKGTTVTRITEEGSFYNMDLLYTGDIFKAYFCEELGWNEAAKADYATQNEQAVVAGK